MDKIKAGDGVLHKPSGEQWYVLGVNYSEDRLCIAGYPPSLAKISDCEYIESFGEITKEELEHRSKQFGDNWE